MSEVSNHKRKLKQFLASTEQHLTEREKSFLESLVGQLSKNNYISHAQQSWMSKILEKYSPEFMQMEEAWKSSFSDSHREQATKVAAYYKANPPYYSNYVHRIELDPENFVLTRREWDKFCDNKYAKKVLEVYSLDPKFDKNDCIQIRSNNRLDLANPSNSSLRRNGKRNEVGFVLAIDAKPVTRSARGSRIYSILLSGASAPIYAHESDLKRKKI